MEITDRPPAAPEASGRLAPSDVPPRLSKGIPGCGPLVLLVLLLWIIPTLFLHGFFDAPTVKTWATIFIAIVVQAVPFLALGVLLSAGIAAFVSPAVFRRVLPTRDALAVPVAGLSGALLPGCECASVPIASSLMARGVAPAAALTFLLAAPAINPVVLVATAVAFPGRPEMVVARFVASLVVSLAMGWLWLRLGRTDWIRLARRSGSDGTGGWAVLRAEAAHDFLQATGFLVIGAATAATLNVAAPRGVLGSVAGSGWLAVPALGLLAVVLAVCSEADAFVASSLTQFSLTARLAFMVVGPAVDMKLFAMQCGVFGRRFAVRFAPTTFAVAVLASALVGWWLL